MKDNRKVASKVPAVLRQNDKSSNGFYLHFIDGIFESKFVIERVVKFSHHDAFF